MIALNIYKKVQRPYEVTQGLKIKRAGNTQDNGRWRLFSSENINLNIACLCKK